MAVGHYENFPVASLLLPAPLRTAVRAIYRFARTADDIADEGSASDAERLVGLAQLGRQLDAIDTGAPHDWPDLAAAVRAHALPTGLLRDLLCAFAQDVTVKRYADYGALLDYCRRSANPIGRLLLTLYRRTDAQSLRQSDAICSALQLTNFWQDIGIDWAKGRLYIPQAALREAGLDESIVAIGGADPGWPVLTRQLTAHARTMLSSGAPLAHSLGGRAGLELRLVVQGGLRILERIDEVNGNVFAQRPALRGRDWLLLVVRALAM